MGDHAVLSPSGFKRIAAGCCGWLQGGAPGEVPEDKDNAAEGNAAHHLYEMIKSGHKVSDLLNTPDPDGTLMTPEMLFYLEDYLKGTEGFAAEVRVHCPWIHPTQCWGTVDAFKSQVDMLRIADLKYGYKWVEAEENVQCIIYAGGVLSEPSVVSHDNFPVEITIYQPRAGHTDGPVRTWVTNVGHIKKRCAEFSILAYQALGENPPFKSGPHCYRCPRLTNCATAKEVSDNCIDLAHNSGHMTNPTDDSLEYDYTTIIRAQEMLKERKTSIEEVMKYRAGNGQRYHNYELGVTYGDRFWKDKEQVKALGELNGIEITEQKLLSPAQAEKKGFNKDLVKQLTDRKPFKKLKPINHEKNRKLFGVKPS